MIKITVILTFFSFSFISRANSLICFTIEETTQATQKDTLSLATLQQESLEKNETSEVQVLMMNAELQDSPQWKLCMSSESILNHTEVNEILKRDDVREALRYKNLEYRIILEDNTPLTLYWSAPLHPISETLQPLISIHPFGQIKHAVWSYSRAKHHMDSVLTCSMNNGSSVSHNFHQSDLPAYTIKKETGVLSIQAQNFSLNQIIRIIQHPNVLNRRYQKERFSLIDNVSPLLPGFFKWVNTQNPTVIEELEFELEI